MTISFSASQLVASGFCKVIILFENFRYYPLFIALYSTDLQCTDSCLGVTRFCCRIEQIFGSLFEFGESKPNANCNNSKAVLLQSWSGPEGSRKLRFPDFMAAAQDGGKVVSLTYRPPLPSGNTPGTHFC